jgi:hypothetical protein
MDSPVTATTKPQPFLSRLPAAASAATGVSWLALVAATSLGIGQMDRVRAAISSDAEVGAEVDGETYRLIVQSYAPDSVGADHLPAAHARPLASAQRAITAEELRKGVEVDIVQLGGEAPAASSVVVAWIERGAPDLELDALTARPKPDAFYGFGPQVTESARVVLRRRSV